MSQIHKYISTNQSIRIAAAITTDLAGDVVAKQNLSPLAATLMGRAITGAVLMASQLKPGQRVGLHFRGEGPVGSLFAEAAYEGGARAYCENKSAELPATSKRPGAGLGKGYLDVIRSLPRQKNPQRGTVELYSGDIGDDLAFYLNQSQQIPAIVALTALPDKAGFELCGGYIIELMPGVTDETLQRLEQIQNNVATVSEQIRGGATSKDLLEPYLTAFDFEQIPHPFEPFHQCVCSQQRMLRSVKILGLNSIEDMLAKQEDATATCEFCGETYQINMLHLEKIRQELLREKAQS
jgi:molecular chaperone Hsp33